MHTFEVCGFKCLDKMGKIFYNVFMRKRLCAAIFIMLTFLSVSFGADNFACAATKTEVFDNTFNTVNEIVLYGDNAKAAADDIVAELKHIDGLFSLTKNSSIKQLNEQGYIDNAADEVVYLMTRAKELYAATDGAFNPATYLLTDLWQLSSRFSDGAPVAEKPYDRPLYTLPEQKYVDAFCKLLDFDKVQIEGSRITLPTDSQTVDGTRYTMQIDLGGIVKGYAAQRAREIAKSYGITEGYISLGQSSIVMLSNPDTEDGKFSVGVINPDNINTFYAKTFVKNTAMSTSGDYQTGKYFELDGRRYCHIIDGSTGQPVNNGIRTVSILCDDPIAADALTTAVMVKGFDEAKAFINGSYFRQNGIQTAFVYQKSWALGKVKEVITNTSKDLWQMTSPDFSVCGYVDDDGNFVYNPKRPNLLLAAIVLAAVAAVLVAVAVKKNGGARPDRQNIRRQKFFRMGDIFVYAAVAACVVGLFLGFVVFRDRAELGQISVYYKNNLVYTYDTQSGKGKIADESFADILSERTVDGKLYLTLSVDGHSNTVEFDGKYAKMTEANCSATKECVNSFPAITQANQVIVCDVNFVKVSGGGDIPILNG